MDEESSNSSDEDESNNYKEECVDRLVRLEWCKCENCEIVTLNNPRDCLCCREVPEAPALADFNSKRIRCAIQHDDFVL